MEPIEQFLTDRLDVRRVQADDAEPLFHAFGHSADATRYLTWTPTESVAEYAQFLRRVALPGWEDGSSFHWTVRLRDDANVVGMVSLERTEHGLELGYVFAPETWGQGLAGEAAEPVVSDALAQADVYRVWATCDCANAASMRVLEKLGFRREGTLRRWSVHPNISDEPRDAYCYSLTV